VAVGFGRLGLREIVALTQPANLASRRVLEKTGFGYERDVVRAALPRLLYRITIFDWQRGNQYERRER
jgi:RimJ/RimL family protein N-acetyltransferase